MDLVLGTNTLGLGGSETYLVTVAEQLDRLGHRATIYAPTVGEAGALARARALRVTDGADLPEDCDAVLVQDAAVAFDLAARYPAVAQVFVAHSTIFDLASPPQLPDLTSAAVVLNGRTASRIAALDLEIDVVRMTQPIDERRFPAGPSLPAKAARVLVLSNRLDHHRRLLEQACTDADLELLELGALTATTLDPAPDLSDADIVVGYGRSILEGMACGRAAYIYDHRGGDGWMTGEKYPAIERDGFAGGAGLGPIDADRLAEDLAGYRPEMGLVNRDLVLAHHRAGPHAERLVALFEAVDGRSATAHGPLDEMARLVRLQWQHQQQLVGEQMKTARLQSAERELRADIHRLETETHELRSENHLLRVENHASHIRETEARNPGFRSLPWLVANALVSAPGRARARLAARRSRPEPQTRPQTTSAIESASQAPDSWEGLVAAASRLDADVVRRGWMSPIPHPDRDLWSKPKAMEGLALEVDSALDWGEAELSPYAGELRSAIQESGLDGRFALWNEAYQAADAELLFAMVRWLRPRRVLELGRGYSTLVLAAARTVNAREGRNCEIVSVDPDPAVDVGDEVPGTRIERRSASELPIDRFLELESGDILFVDTTHSVKLGSEVNYVVLDVLPRLAPGVVVHFHDVFLPYEYPREWYERGMFFAEQYLLQAFLSGNPGYRVLFPAHAARRAHAERLARVLPSLAEPRAKDWIGPAAFWIRRRS